MLQFIGAVQVITRNQFIICLFCRDNLPESAYKYQLLGLNLLCLLSQNRLAEFHTVSNQHICEMMLYGSVHSYQHYMYTRF